MQQGDVILFLRPLRPINIILARRSFHKFYSKLERKFAGISHQVSTIDPWLESEYIQGLLTKLLNQANRFIITIDSWFDEGLLERWMTKDANRLWELVVRYVYKKRGLKFEIPGYESIQK